MLISVGFKESFIYESKSDFKKIQPFELFTNLFEPLRQLFG